MHVKNWNYSIIFTGEKDEVQKNGKVFTKLALGEYEWMSYNVVHASVLSFGAGLRFCLHQKAGDLITMYAETRAEWMISCLGAFSQVRNSVILLSCPSLNNHLRIDEALTDMTNIFLLEHCCCNSLYKSWRWCRSARNQRNKNFCRGDKSRIASKTSSIARTGKIDN